MTFSIVAFDPDTEELGVAVASKFLGVGGVVPFAKAGVGAVASQSLGNPIYGTKGLELLAAGKSVEETLQLLIDEDDQSDWRQVGIVDSTGNSITYTGGECYDWAGGVADTNFAIQGNILVSEDTIKAIHSAFLDTTGDLATRLIKALLAGDLAGGDSRGKQSAALLVVKENAGYGGLTDKYIDLRVDDHVEPVQELERLLYLHHLYFKPSKAEDILKIDDKLEQELKKYLTKLNYLNDQSEHLFDALKTFQYVENFDERVQEDGYIDSQVLEFIKNRLDQ
ncbi:DUF1028 domain-containing protein [Amphibacillus sediminis]|uniref:DUF1028 domain-containing protein n=1 Tax=Amphibacillus sediminis TaxID=360185 RepID=UPI0008301161|nr:DUF1028 domain-containing protein [Amphibacillus sediminis]